MPATSPEAKARKQINDNARKRTQRAAIRKAKEATAKPAAVKSPNRKWHIGPPAPQMSKSELRAMLAQAMANTAALSC